MWDERNDAMAGNTAVRSRPKVKVGLPTSPVHTKSRGAHPRRQALLGKPISAPPNVAQIRRLIGFSQPEFGRMTSYSTRVVAEWESGKALDTRARRKVTEIDRLLRALSELMPATEVGKWLREANQAFDGRTPLQLIEHGESDRLWQMIHQIDANAAN
jgi:hypothetical protein